MLQNIHGTMEFLQKFPPFNQMDTAHLAFLVEHCQLRFYAEGDSIIKPSDGPVEHFYIVKQGRVHGERPHSARRGTETTFEITSGECFPLAAHETAFAVEFLPGQFDQRAEQAHDRRAGQTRLARQCESAQNLAEWLEQQKNVTAVHYPGLKSHPQHALAKKQMNYFGSVLSFEIAGGKPAATKLLSALNLIRPAVTLGGPETLISHSASSTHNSVDAETKTKTGLTDSLLRLSVGLEACDDIRDDLASALAVTN